MERPRLKKEELPNVCFLFFVLTQQSIIGNAADTFIP